MYELIEAGIEAYDIFTKTGRYAGLVVQKPAGHHVIYWNSNASKGSARKFNTREEAIEFMHQRRVKKGMAA